MKIKYQAWLMAQSTKPACIRPCSTDSCVRTREANVLYSTTQEEFFSAGPRRSQRRGVPAACAGCGAAAPAPAMTWPRPRQS